MRDLWPSSCSLCKQNIRGCYSRVTRRWPRNASWHVRECCALRRHSLEGEVPMESWWRSVVQLAGAFMAENSWGHTVAGDGYGPAGAGASKYIPNQLEWHVLPPRSTTMPRMTTCSVCCRAIERCRGQLQRGPHERLQRNRTGSPAACQTENLRTPSCLCPKGTLRGCCHLRRLLPPTGHG